MLGLHYSIGLSYSDVDSEEKEELFLN